MIIRVLAGSNRHRDMMLADQVVGQADVVEVVDLEHDVIQPPFLRTDAERDGMIAVVTMHKNRGDDPVSHPDLIFDTAAHSELHIKAPCRGRVVLSDNAMTQAATAGIKPPVHSTSGIER